MSIIMLIVLKRTVFSYANLPVCACVVDFFPMQSHHDDDLQFQKKIHTHTCAGKEGVFVYVHNKAVCAKLRTGMYACVCKNVGSFERQGANRNVSESPDRLGSLALQLLKCVLRRSIDMLITTLAPDTSSQYSLYFPHQVISERVRNEDFPV